MSEHRHYVPILKTKAGERWAIEQLTPEIKHGLTPLFEIHRNPDRRPVEHARDVCTSLREVWPGNSPVYLDPTWIQEPADHAAVLTTIFDHARSIGLRAVPTVRITDDQSVLDAVKSICSRDGLGCLLRITHDSVGANAAINGVTGYLGLPLDQIDFMIDYRNHAMNLVNDVVRVPAVLEWRKLISASAAFPRSLAGYPLHEWHSASRHDWTSWVTPVRSGSLARKPAYSDYLIRDHGPPAEGGAPSACLRYTRDQQWLIRIGGKLRDGAAPDMFGICKSLVESGEFDGPQFSQGDLIISEMASGIRTTPGGAQQWLQWAMNHHLTFVVHQIAHTPGL